MKHGDHIVWPDGTRGRIENPADTAFFVVELESGGSLVRTKAQLMHEGVKVAVYVYRHCRRAPTANVVLQPLTEMVERWDREARSIETAYDPKAAAHARFLRTEVDNLRTLLIHLQIHLNRRGP